MLTRMALASAAAFVDLSDALSAIKSGCTGSSPARLSGTEFPSSAVVSTSVPNLLDNAIKHGASAVTVVADSCQGWQTLKVMDDGHGVPPDRLQQLQAALQAGTAKLGISARVIMCFLRHLPELRVGSSVFLVRAWLRFGNLSWLIPVG